MQKRLLIQLDEREYAEIQAAALRQGLSVSEWARQSLRDALRRRHRIEQKRAVLEACSAYSFPTADIEVMLAEIGRGYSGSPA